FDHGLQPMILLREGMSFLLICDLDASAAGRAWAFLEIGERLQITENLAIEASQISVAANTSLPVPSEDWAAFLTVVQGVRTGKIAKAEAQLAQMGLAAELSRPLFRKFLDIDLDLSANLSQCGDALSKLQQVVKLKKRTPASAPLTENPARLLRRLLNRLYLVHRGQPLLFTLHGPDGVGKTTVCAEVERIFARLPLPFASFHHITGWKVARKKSGGQADGPARKGDPEWQPGIVHRSMRAVYRLMPQSVRELYVLVQGYHHYLAELSGLIYGHFRANRIMLVDRYIYDLTVKNIVAEVRPRWVHALFARLARRPARAILLTDEPEKIYQRKQELNVDEIKTYLLTIKALLKETHVSVETVDVAGRFPEAIARDIATRMLDVCAPSLLILLRAYRSASREQGEEHTGAAMP
ncbi:MAG: hypothetical protein AB7O70_16445, partial [Hyphomicrobiales bacterium]